MSDWTDYNKMKESFKKETVGEDSSLMRQNLSGKDNQNFSNNDNLLGRKNSSKYNGNILVTFRCLLYKNVKFPENTVIEDTFYIKNDKRYEKYDEYFNFIKEQVAYNLFNTRDVKKFKKFIILWIGYERDL